MNEPATCVAVWFVTSQRKLPQLEKSGSALGSEAAGFTDAAVAVPCTTHVPSNEGVEVLVVEVVPVPVGPSTVVVRSTPQAAVAMSAARVELNKKADLFMGLCPRIGRRTYGLYV